jgi:hypothetical protein
MFSELSKPFPQSPIFLAHPDYVLTGNEYSALAALPNIRPIKIGTDKLRLIF